MSSPAEVASLLAQLQALEVDLPAKVSDGARRLRMLSAAIPGGPAPTAPNLLDVDDEGLVAAFRSTAISFAIRGEVPREGPASQAQRLLRLALGDQLAAALAAGADDVLDALRPKFDEAADVVHAASETGINEHTTDRDIVKAEDVASMATAWRALPAAVDVLEQIAAVRIGLSKAAGVPPAVPPLGVEEVAGSMFRQDSPRWRRQWEHPWQRWVRLCTGSPARLLSVAQSAAAWSDSSRAFVDEGTDDEERAAAARPRPSRLPAWAEQAEARKSEEVR